VQAHGALSAPPAPAQRDPLALEPDHGPPDRLPQERHVLRDQQEADRQHLDPHHRQEPEQAAEDVQTSTNFLCLSQALLDSSPMT
jgi:hypothetical protein